MQTKQDYYRILGIAPNASAAEIKQAYRRLAFRHHPDKNPLNLVSDEMMKEINEAYATLSDPANRRKYDIPLGYQTISPKFNTGGKVVVNSHSSPFKDHTGIVDKPPFSDAFRFWYIVRFESKGLTAIGQFAEEELHAIEE